MPKKKKKLAGMPIKIQVPLTAKSLLESKAQIRADNEQFLC